MAKVAPDIVDDTAVYDGGGTNKEEQDRLIAAEAMSDLCSGLGLPSSSNRPSTPPYNGSVERQIQEKKPAIREEQLTMYDRIKSNKKSTLLDVAAARRNEELDADADTNNGLHRFDKFVEKNLQHLEDVTVKSFSTPQNDIKVETLKVEPVVIKTDVEGSAMLVSPSWNEFDASCVLESLKQGKPKAKRTKEERREAKKRKKAKLEAKIAEALKNGSIFEWEKLRDDQRRAKKKRSRSETIYEGTTASVSSNISYNATTNVPPNVPSNVNFSVNSISGIPLPVPSSHVAIPRPIGVPPTSNGTTLPIQTSFQPAMYPIPVSAMGMFNKYEYIGSKEPSALLQALKSRPQHNILLQPTVTDSSALRLPETVHQQMLPINGNVYPCVKQDITSSIDSSQVQDGPLNLSLHTRTNDPGVIKIEATLNRVTNIDGGTHKYNANNQVILSDHGLRTTQIAHVNPYINAVSADTHTLTDKAARKLKKKRKKEKLARKLVRENSTLCNSTENLGELSENLTHKSHKSKHKKKKRDKDEPISESIDSGVKGNMFGGVNMFNALPKLMLCSNSGVLNVPQAVVHPTIVSAPMSPQFYMVPANSIDTNKQAAFPVGYEAMRLSGSPNFVTNSISNSYPIISQFQPVLTNGTPLYHSTPSYTPYNISNNNHENEQLRSPSRTAEISSSRPQNLLLKQSLVSISNWRNSPAVTRFSESVLHQVSTKEYAKECRRSQQISGKISCIPVTVNEKERRLSEDKTDIKGEAVTPPCLSPVKREGDKSSTTSTYLPFKKRKLEQYRAEVEATTPEEPTLLINPAYSLQCLDENNLLVQPDDDGDIPLHIAVARENLDAVKDYLRLMTHAGCDLDVLNTDRQTPLHIAVVMNQKECVQMLLDAGANIELTSSRGLTSLHLAVIYGDLDLLEILLDNDRAQSCLCLRDFDGFSVLHTAVNAKNLGMVQLLLQHVPDINIKDGKSGRSPLFHAVENGDEHMVTLLLLHSANANITNYSGNTPLVAASGRGFYEIAFSLVSHGAETKGYDFGEVCKSGNPNFSPKMSQLMQQQSTVASLKRKLENSRLAGLKKLNNAPDDAIGPNQGQSGHHRDYSPSESETDNSIGQNKEKSPSDSVLSDTIRGKDNNMRIGSGISDTIGGREINRRMDFVKDDSIGRYEESSPSDFVSRNFIGGKFVTSDLIGGNVGLDSSRTLKGTSDFVIKNENGRLLDLSRTGENMENNLIVKVENDNLEWNLSKSSTENLCHKNLAEISNDLTQKSVQIVEKLTDILEERKFDDDNALKSYKIAQKNNVNNDVLTMKVNHERVDSDMEICRDIPEVGRGNKNMETEPLFEIVKNENYIKNENCENFTHILGFCKENGFADNSIKADKNQILESSCGFDTRELTEINKEKRSCIMDLTDLENGNFLISRENDDKISGVVKSKINELLENVLEGDKSSVKNDTIGLDDKSNDVSVKREKPEFQHEMVFCEKSPKSEKIIEDSPTGKKSRSKKKGKVIRRVNSKKPSVLTADHRDNVLARLLKTYNLKISDLPSNFAYSKLLTMADVLNLRKVVHVWHFRELKKKSIKNCASLENYIQTHIPCYCEDVNSNNTQCFVPHYDVDLCDSMCNYNQVINDVNLTIQEILNVCEVENLADDSGIDLSSEYVYSNNDDVM